MKSRKTVWSEEELKQLNDFVAAGGTPLRASVRFKRTAAADRLQTDYTPILCCVRHSPRKNLVRPLQLYTPNCVLINYPADEERQWDDIVTRISHTLASR
jgi:hypothetical protein